MTEHKEWFTTSELAGMPGLSKHSRVIRIKADRESWQSRKRQKGKGFEYHLSSLPVETQAALVKQAEPAQPAKLKAPVIADFSYDKDALWQHFESKPQKQQDEAKQRLDYILQVMTLVEAGGMMMKDAFAAIAKQHDLSERTLKGWYNGTSGRQSLKKYHRSDWLAALVPAFVGRTAKVDIDDEAWDIFKADYLRLEQPTASDCYRRLKRIAAQRQWLLPSLKTFERRIQDIPLAVRVLKREGENALLRMYPAQERTVSSLHALMWINGDGYQHNVFVQWPNGDIDRPKTWFWQDVYSRKILAYRVDMTENTDTIRMSFGDVVEQYGIPQHVTIDNTRAAANKWMTGGVKNRYRFKVLEDDPIGLIPALGCQLHWTSVYNGKGHGQAKPVERAFGVGGLGDAVDKAPRFEGAYTGPNTTEKPENYGKNAIDIETFLAVLEQEIIEWNARTGRRTEMAEGEKSFDQVFEESYKTSVITTANEEQRRMWLLSAEAIKVSTEGTFTLDAGKATGKGRNRYHASDLFEFARQKIVVRFDPQNLHGTVYAYTLDGRYITECDCIEATGFGDTEAARSFNKHRTRFIKATKLAAKAEVAMDAIEVADALPLQKQPDIANPKVVRPLRPAPQLGRPVPAPELTEEQEQDYAVFQAAFDLPKPTAEVAEIDDPQARFSRWKNLDKRLHAGQQLSEKDQKFWAMYQKGNEFKSMQEFMADFEGFDLGIEA